MAPERFALQLTMPADMHDDLREAQELSSHETPAPDVTEILRRALKEHVQRLRQHRFAETSRPGPSRGSQNPRHIPAHVKRAVWARDGGQCTFVSSSGHRCDARRHLQHDHVLEVSRGGDASVANIRLRCHAHNQLAAEQSLGAEFMRRQRLASQEAREAEREARRAQVDAASRVSK